MKNNLFILIFSTLLYSCNQPKKDIYIDISNPVKPVITVIISTNTIHSLQKNNTAIDFNIASNNISLYLVTNNIASNNKIIGNYFLKNDSLQFVPYFDLGYGLNFEAQLYINGDTIKKRFSTPKSIVTNEPSVKATQIFPLIDKIPTNILLFHAIFSDTMNEDAMAFDKVQVIDEKGNSKPKVWKEKSYWLNNAMHLVLMIHPGRIKRDINYLKELGPVFEVGKQYTIILTTALKDKYDRSLYKEYRKTFTAIAPDRIIPKILYKNFKIPTANTKNPLQFLFSEPMDYASVCMGLKLFDVKGNIIKGKIEPDLDDARWNFIPEQAWRKVSYKVEFSNEITDLASNHLNRPFETKDAEAYSNNKIIQWNFIPE